jgi:hypothetical protein
MVANGGIVSLQPFVTALAIGPEHTADKKHGDECQSGAP